MNTAEVINICSDLENVLKQYGNINFLNKEDLYSLIDYIRNRFNINPNNVFNISRFCQDNFSEIISYELHNFRDIKIGGFLVKNQLPEKSFITVNSSKEPICYLFDLTHEMIHFLLHPENRNNYISSSLSNFDNFEWQANEGAAELLVPYKRFIPFFTSNIKNCKTKKDYNDFIDFLAQKFIVSPAVIRYRIDSLKYEIHQYENNVPIDELSLLSTKSQEEEGIFINSYNQIFQKQPSTIKSILNNMNNKSNFTSSSIKIESWNDVLEALKKDGYFSLYIHLFRAQLIFIDINTVEVKFPDGITNFKKNIIEKPNNSRQLNFLIEKLFQKKMTIKFS